VSASGSFDRPDPNLTPLLDIVFQLIAFFVMVINFSNENYDQRVRLPVAGTAQPVEEGERVSEDRLVLNVDRRGHLLWNGQALPTNKAIDEIKHQAELVKINLKAARQKFDPATGLPTTIVLRADRDTPFDLLFSLITACQASGFHKFSLKAMNAAG
jgi:biopolymer transport protein ExbD